MERLVVSTKSPEETQLLGSWLGELLEGGEVFLLSGSLGAGKTCLTQGIAWGLGVPEYARSPTFVLVSEYEGRLTLYHVDLYRLDDITEIDDLGLDEYFYGEGVCVVEWAEKAGPLLPEEALHIKIQTNEDESRLFIIEARGKRYQQLLGQWSEAAQEIETRASKTK